MNGWAVIGLYIASSAVLLGDDNWACIPELRLPQYPSLARQARLSGKALVSLRVDGQGKPTEILVEGVHRFLERTVSDSIRRSRFSIGCEGRILHFQFNFELESPAKQVDSGYVLFRPPNIFVLRAAYFPISGHSTQ
jgi:hypothetical protein